MPELYLAMDRLVSEGKLEQASHLQHRANAIIEEMCSCHGNMYAVIKKILEMNEGLLLGSVRSPLAPLCEADLPIVESAAKHIREAVAALAE